MLKSSACRIGIASVLALAGCGGETHGLLDAGSRDGSDGRDAATTEDGGGGDQDGGREDGGPVEDAGAFDGGQGVACGGFVGSVCAGDRYCDYPEGCGFADGTGVCRPRPLTCPELYSPVCGCDGVTYGNDCEAFAAGADVLHAGECSGSPCAAQDARGEGLCDAILGVAWSGRECVYLSGCECVGTDCDALYASLEGCAAAHAACTATACGSRGMPPCRADQFCDFSDAAMCGASDMPGVCRPRPSACPGVYMPVCGCDGSTYGNACDAHAAGIDDARAGTCEGTISCSRQDATPVGTCRAVLGWAWDGGSCVSITGCECVGADCGSLWPTEGECVRAHDSCMTARGCGGLLGLMCSDTEYCDYPPGGMCGAADEMGTCLPRPAGCPDVYAPVCGCDGRTHGNECEAHAAGTDVSSRGACPP